MQRQAIGQGTCGEIDSFPFTTASGEPAGWVMTYRINGVFEAAPGFRFARTTFGVLEWIDIPSGIPFGPDGNVNFERFILQSRSSPPAEVVAHRVPMDLITEQLVVYRILPRAALRQGKGTIPPMWAGGRDAVGWSPGAFRLSRTLRCRLHDS